MSLIDVRIKARKQFRPFLTSKKRWSVVVAHRRAGKTVACIQKLTQAALECQRPEGRFAYVAPQFNQAKDIAWSYLKRYGAALHCEMNESELRLDFPNGARIRLYGADNPDRLRGLYLDGVVLDEYADMRPSVWGEVVRPMLADRGGWATFIGTPKGRNEFHAIWQGAQGNDAWFAMMLKASESGLITPDELDAIRSDPSVTPEQYEQEFECSFEAAIQGAYYGRELAQAEREGRIKALAIEPGYPVHTAWDLGKGQNMPVWCFQVIGDQIRVVDYLQDYNYTIERLAADLTAKGYRGTDFVPHDAKAAEISTGRTRIETLLKLGRKPHVVADHKVMDGINAGRLTLANTWFDEVQCAEGLEALRQYRADYDERLKTFKDVPRHDWASHPADAFRYLAMGWREVKAPVIEPPKPIKTVQSMTFDEYAAFTPRPKNWI